MLEIFGENWETIVAIITPIGAGTIIGIYKFIKNKLANNMVSSFLSKVKGELGDDEYTAIEGVVKSYAGKKGIQALTELTKKIELLEVIVPILTTMARNQLNLGLYDTEPELKEIIENALNNVE